jgi:flagellar motor switch/type III secretory pathway protein FliN
VPADAAVAGTGSALVPSARKPGKVESEPGFGPLVARLPVELDVAVPVREFRVRHLLALEPGTVIESQWNHGNDLPLAAGEVTLAWTEFEVIETRLGVRVTRLA